MSTTAKPIPSDRDWITVALSTGATGITSAVELNGHTLCTIQMDSGWTDAVLSFQASLDGTNFFNVYDTGGNEVSYTTTASRMLQVDPILWAPFSHIKIRSGTNGTPVAQAAARTLTLGIL